MRTEWAASPHVAYTLASIFGHIVSLQNAIVGAELPCEIQLCVHDFACILYDAFGILQLYDAFGILDLCCVLVCVWELGGGIQRKQ